MLQIWHDKLATTRVRWNDGAVVLLWLKFKLRVLFRSSCGSRHVLFVELSAPVLLCTCLTASDVWHYWTKCMYLCGGLVMYATINCTLWNTETSYMLNCSICFHAQLLTIIVISYILAKVMPFFLISPSLRAGLRASSSRLVEPRASSFVSTPSCTLTQWSSKLYGNEERHQVM